MDRLLALAQNLCFTIGVTFVSRLFRLVDRLRRSPEAFRAETTGSRFTRYRLPSGRNTLEAVFASASAHPPRAALLLCHGIGETVEDWRAVQHLLAQLGVASLAFDYSGYGRSTGHIAAAQCEQDAIAAFAHLQQLAPGLPPSILGFSLGSGVAAGVVNGIPAERLLLCAAFSSFRRAAARLGFPALLVPPIWNTAHTLASTSLPVLVLHGARDRLFPTQMARELHQARPQAARLIVFTGMAHDDPYRHPQIAYWRLVADFLTAGSHPR